MKRFYMVTVDGGSAPQARHATAELAAAEAARICQKQGQRAYVLMVISACEPVANVVWDTSPIEG